MAVKFRQRRCFDRRSGRDRRRAYSLDYFEMGGRERRRHAERRQRRGRERRAQWLRVDQDVSIFRDWPEEIDASE